MHLPNLSRPKIYFKIPSIKNFLRNAQQPSNSTNLSNISCFLLFSLSSLEILLTHKGITLFLYFSLALFLLNFYLFISFSLNPSFFFFFLFLGCLFSCISVGSSQRCTMILRNIKTKYQQTSIQHIPRNLKSLR